MIQHICETLEDTENVAKHYARLAKPGVCFALMGDLGSGKTTFSQYLIRCLNPNIKDVSSPTFSIVQMYNSDICEIVHVDCYRLESQDEFYELGLDELFYQCISIIEWPEIIKQHLPADTIYIRFEVTGDNKRKIASSCV